MGGDLQVKEGHWKLFSVKPYECCVYVCPDESGGLYAYIPTLPGVVSEGDSEEEVIKNIADAFRGAASSYNESKMPIPWKREAEPKPHGAKELRIVVDV